jgi:hypothetical protein
MPRAGRIGGLNSIRNQQTKLVDQVDGYPVAIKNIIQVTPTTTTDSYWAFGNGVRVGDNIFYGLKRGPSHVGGTNVSGLWYNIPTDTWGVPYEIAVTGSSDIFSGVACGKIGTSLYIFVSKYNGGTDLFTATGYIKSTDLTGTSWGSYTTITAPPYERYESYGKFQESVTTPGKFFTTRFSHKDGGSDPWALEVIKITADGATWTPIEWYDGAVKYSEMALVNRGGSNWFGLARKFETNGVFGLFSSTDDCETVTLVGNTDLGAGPGNGDLIYYNGLIHFLFQNRATGQVQVSKNNTAAQCLSLDFNAPVNYYANGTGDATNGLGYPWWEVLYDDNVYMTFCREISSGRANVFGTLDKISNI